ncbi:MAG: acetyl-CoA carboxylase biotin carboxyl carrier protein [Elusimicrobiota bacterium]
MPQEDKNGKKENDSINGNNANPAMIRELKSLYQLMRDENIVNLQIEDEGKKVHLKRYEKVSEQVIVETHVPMSATRTLLPSASQSIGATQQGVKQDSAVKHGFKEIKAPLIGIFYRSPSPSSPAFVEVGQVVNPGQTLCIIEAMKVMNEVTANSKCKIEKILVENNHAVTAGQVIFWVSPA